MYYLPWRGTRRSSKAFDRLAFAVPSAFTGVAIEEPAVVCLVVLSFREPATGRH